MKKALVILMVLALTLTCMVVSFADEASTEPQMKTVYISDNGNFRAVLVNFIKLCCEIKLFMYNNSRKTN